MMYVFFAVQKIINPLTGPNNECLWINSLNKSQEYKHILKQTYCEPNVNPKWCSPLRLSADVHVVALSKINSLLLTQMINEPNYVFEEYVRKNN